MPHLTGRSPVAPERPALVQRRDYAAGDRSSALLMRDFERGSQFALVERRWKLIHRSTGVDELHDLAADPYEIRDQASLRPDRVAAMRSRLLERIEERAGEAGPEPKSVDAASIERLRALG